MRMIDLSIMVFALLFVTVALIALFSSGDVRKMRSKFGESNTAYDDLRRLSVTHHHYSSLPEKEKKNVLSQELSAGSSGRRSSIRNIERIAVIGERNSGTSWMFDYLTSCYNHSIDVENSLIRYKHFFQDDDVHLSYDRKPTMVISMFRDPYYWVEAMRSTPHHAPSHYHESHRNGRMDWYEFVTTPWSMHRTSKDKEFLEELELKNKGISHPELVEKEACKAYYSYNRVNSCVRYPFSEELSKKLKHFSAKEPQYELRDDGSGRAYGSVIELRADKIRNFLKVKNWKWVDDYVLLQYEDLLSKGTQFLLDHISEATGHEAKCKPTGSQNRPKRNLSPEFIEWMNKYVDWEAEGLVGYSKRGTDTSEK